MSHDSLIALRIANRKKQIMVGFRLLLNHFERIVNPKAELTSELCFTGVNDAKVLILAILGELHEP